MLAMFKWFFGTGPRPKFDRWTYWEKFDYWAPFWGVTIIGLSGLIMWLPGFFGAFLPGWIFNVAAIFHGEEAFLAVVFLFTVHFFNNHFRPDKFPVEVVMFTGTMSLEEFKTDHGVEYQRLLDSGELEQPAGRTAVSGQGEGVQGAGVHADRRRIDVAHVGWYRIFQGWLTAPIERMKSTVRASFALDRGDRPAAMHRVYMAEGVQ